MRLGFLLVLLFSLSIQAQDPVAAPDADKNEGPPRYKIKLNLFDQSVFSLPCIKFHNEILIGGESNSNYNYLSADVGYNYFSVDEQVPVHGIYTGLRFNHYLPSYGDALKCFSFGAFYQYTAIKDYLKTEKTYPGLGTFSEYEKMRYNKQRYGVNIEFMRQHTIYGPVFLEYSVSIGYIFMETKTPERVTQSVFVNGTTYKKNANLPSLGFSAKIGYSLF